MIRLSRVLAVGLAVLWPFGVSAATITLTVSGTSNVWLAGAPDGTTAVFSDVAPANSPVEAGGLDLSSGMVTFDASGLVSNGVCCPFVGPDGDVSYSSHFGGQQNGISDVVAPLNSLLGVFLDDSVPAGSAPAALNFFALGLDFQTLSPAIRQVFFIGDGTAAGLAQSFIVPAGATRLFLATMDAFDNNNNLGAFTVRVSDGLDSSPVPEPATLLVFGAGLAGIAARRRFKAQHASLEER